MSKIEIPLSKTKLFFIIAGSALFIIAGLYLCLIVANQQTKFPPLLIQGVGIIGILFFGATGILGIRKIFDNKIGLIIDDEGIIDNSSGVSIGLIKWSDIVQIRSEQVSSTQFLLIYITDPTYYMGLAKGFKRKMMEANYKIYGTPLSFC